MSVSRTVDQQQRKLARMLAKVERMIEAVRDCLQEEGSGDATHAG